MRRRRRNTGATARIDPVGSFCAGRAQRQRTRIAGSSGILRFAVPAVPTAVTTVATTPAPRHPLLLRSRSCRNAAAGRIVLVALVQVAR